MTRTKTRPFDVAEHLDSPETIAAYLNEKHLRRAT